MRVGEEPKARERGNIVVRLVRFRSCILVIVINAAPTHGTGCEESTRFARLRELGATLNQLKRETRRAIGGVEQTLRNRRVLTTVMAQAITSTGMCVCVLYTCMQQRSGRE